MNGIAATTCYRPLDWGENHPQFRQVHRPYGVGLEQSDKEVPGAALRTDTSSVTQWQVQIEGVPLQKKFFKASSLQVPQCLAPEPVSLTPPLCPSHADSP